MKPKVFAKDFSNLLLKFESIKKGAHTSEVRIVGSYLIYMILFIKLRSCLLIDSKVLEYHRKAMRWLRSIVIHELLLL